MSKIYKPMLYSTPMVQATLANKKNQTRRTQGLEEINENPDDFTLQSTFVIGDDLNVKDKKAVGFHAVFKHSQGHIKTVKAKYAVGDIIWVRETLLQNGELGLDYKADGQEIDEDLIPEDFNVRVDKNGIYKFCAIPNIYMPKCLARTFLKVTNVRCERLRDITEADAIAEGVYQHSDYGSTGYRHYGRPDEALTDIDAVWSFETLWESINGKDSWKANPWVWVYELKQIEKPAVWPS